MRHEVFETDQVQPGNPIGRGELLLWAALGALLSLLVTGFVMGASNNLFHLAIVGSLFDEPQYRDDAFMQSLRYFASGVWLLLRGSEKHVDPFWLFLGLNVGSRFITFLGFLCCAGLLGIRSRKDVAIFTLLLAACSLMRGASYAGAGGLFVNIFTHSELANGITLFALYFLARGAIATSFAANGAVFFVNAFVAVWNAVPYAMVIADGLRRRQWSVSSVALHGAIGLGLFALIAAPVLVNIAGNPDFGQKFAFDYVGFLNGYYPNHFIAASIPPFHFVAVGLVVATGILSFYLIGPAARMFQLMLAGYVLVYLIGVLVPFVTSSSTLLNVHFLRVSTFFHILAALGVLTVATRWLQSENVMDARLLAPALIVVTCTVRHGGILAPFILLVSFIPPLAQATLTGVVSRLRFTREAMLAVAAVVLTWAVWTGWNTNRSLNSWIADWTATGEWARANTDPMAVFMVPTVDLMAGRDDKTLEKEVAEVGPTTFELTSHRRVWVDFRRGAAVMWSGSYFEQWRQRVDAQALLQSLDQRIAYARRNGISHVIDPCTDQTVSGATMRAGRLCVFSVN